VKQLVTDGAKNLLVLGVPDIGKAPNVMEGLANGSDTPSVALDTEASQLASAYNTDLSSQLATIASADTVNVHVIDTYQLIDNAVANPGAYGLTNVTSPVWTGNFTSAGSGTLATTPRKTSSCSGIHCTRPRPAIRRSPTWPRSNSAARPSWRSRIPQRISR
jgi:phospholipase/lecithinase/hemolysin